MAVLRSPLPSTGYTIVRNCWLRDTALSYKGKGLLAYLCSHAEGYRITQTQIIRETADGRDSVVSGLAELERAGYLRRTRAESTGGRFPEYDFELTDPFDAEGNRAGNPHKSPGSSAGDPHRAGSPHGDRAGNPHRVTRNVEDQGEDQGEDQHPTPSGAGGAQLALVTDGTPAENINQRAKRLTDTYTASVGGMVAFMAVRNVVVRACANPAGWDDDTILTALATLHGAGRSITLANLDHALNGRVRAPAGRPAPYRDPTPTDYARPL